MQKKIVTGVVAAAVIAAGAWMVVSLGNSPENQETPQSADAVARVNGEAITRAEFDAFAAQAAGQQGVDIAALTDEQRQEFETWVMDGVIAERLVKQAAIQAGATASDEEIEERIVATKTQLGGDEAYQQALLAEGLTDDEVRARVRQDLMVQNYLAEALDLESLAATDVEVAALYEQSIQGGGENIPALDEVRGQVELMVVQNKQQELLAAHVDTLRAAAEVEILL